MEVEQYKFNHPTSFIINGATQSGKTTFVKNLLTNKNVLFKNPPKTTYLVYKIWQPLYLEMKQADLVTEFIQGIPEINDLFKIFSKHKDTNGCFFIFDDIFSDIKKQTDEFTQLFTVVSHHLK